MLESKLKAPVFTARTQGRQYGEFVLEPLERGFGVTLGNPLRRILLSSIPGTAVTSVYIEDVLHEFSTIPGVKEDVVEIILNLKEVVVRFLDPKMESTTLILKAEGPKEVRAGDFTPSADVEIMNPDLHIATLEEGGKLYMEVRVDRGWGTCPPSATASRTASTPSLWTPSSPRCAGWPSRWRTPAWASARTWTSSP
jgi:DNA-directed RNA polymerase subunit alpha